MLGVGLFYPRAVNEMRMLAQAVNQAKSDDSKAIAGQLEGMKGEGFDGGEIFMRKDDHQLFQDMFISSFGPLDPGAKFDEEGTGWGWKTVGVAASGAEFGTPSVISKTRCDSPCLPYARVRRRDPKEAGSAHARLSSVALAFGTRLPFAKTR